MKCPNCREEITDYEDAWEDSRTDISHRKIDINARLYYCGNCDSEYKWTKREGVKLRDGSDKPTHVPPRIPDGQEEDL